VSRSMHPTAGLETSWEQQFKCNFGQENSFSAEPGWWAQD